MRLKLDAKLPRTRVVLDLVVLYFVVLVVQVDVVVKEVWRNPTEYVF